MKAWTRFEDWTNLVLGVYLFAVPFLFGTTGEAASSWNAYVVGAVVAVVAVWTLAAPTSKAAEWINVVAGAWLLVSPFALGFTDTAAALWNALIVGVLVISFAAAALGRMSRTHGRTQDQS
jgi:SPW repeat-containing protein